VQDLSDEGGGAVDLLLTEERMSRQAILTREDPPVLLILFTESVLDWPIGGPEVMRNQPARLLEASELSDVGISIVPRSAGAHYGFDGSFKIMSGPSGDVACTESPGGGRLVPSAEEVRSHLLRYDRIGE
jgi:hypothetical protein